MSSKQKSKIVNSQIGIYDPDGLNNNPFTNKPYENLYSHIKKNINGEIVPATYSNLAKIWKTRLVYLHKDRILNSIKENQITLAKAGTGVGKTVLIPKLALHAFDYKEKVICTIPKKVITRSTAEFAAQCLDVKIGEEVGYYFKGENKTSEKSTLIFTTTGSIISKMTGSDPYLKEYKCIIIDEAHERSVQTDQLLLLLKKAMIKRKDLKLVIMSATINLEVFRNYYPKPFKFGEVDAGETTSYEIQDYWLDKQPKPNEWKELAIKQIISILKSNQQGDILVFIRAASDGKTLCESLHRESNKLKSTSDIKINPFCVVLSGKSLKEDEMLAIDETQYLELNDTKGSAYTRKVVMATNVAESSLTVDGIVYVIDCGLEYNDSYEPSTMSRCLSEEPIAHSALKQRRGRGGRTKPGVCYHLYTKEHANQLQKYPTPSIQKSDITSDILDLFKLEYINNVKELKSFLNEFINPPKHIFISSSLKTLHALNCISSTKDDGTITELGFAITKFRSIKPQLAKALIASYYYKCSRSVCNIVALLIIADGMVNSIFNDFREDKKKNPKINAIKKQQYYKSRMMFTHKYGDKLSMLKAYTAYREKEQEFFNEKQQEQEQREQQEHLDNIDKNNKPVTILEQIKKDNSIAIKNSTPQKLEKSIKLLRKLNVNKTIIKSFIEQEKIKKSLKPSKPSKGGGLSSKSKKSSRKSKKGSRKSKKGSRKSKKGSIKEIEKQTRNIKKWCQEHFINYNKLVKVKHMSQQIHRNLKDVMRMTSFKPQKSSKSSKKSFVDENDTANYDIELEQKGGVRKENPLDKYFKFNIDYNIDIDDRIILSLLNGMFINVAKLTNPSKMIYSPCFPNQNIDAKINMDSLLKTPSKLVFYEELFMFNKSSKILKLNLCSQIPIQLVEDVKDLYNDHIKNCFIETKQKSFSHRKQNSSRKKTRNNKNRKGNKYSRKRNRKGKGNRYSRKNNKKGKQYSRKQNRNSRR